MAAAAPLLAKMSGTLTVTHQTGEKDYAEVAAAYVLPVCRRKSCRLSTIWLLSTGLLTLLSAVPGRPRIAEVTACGKPCIFIPFPHAVDDHQRKNAEALLKCSAGFMLLERELTAESLVRQIAELFARPELLRETGANARNCRPD